MKKKQKNESPPGQTRNESTKPRHGDKKKRMNGNELKTTTIRESQNNLQPQHETKKKCRTSNTSSLSSLKVNGNEVKKNGSRSSLLQ